MHPNAFTFGIAKSLASRSGFVKILTIGSRYRRLKTKGSIPRSYLLNIPNPALKRFPEGRKGCALIVKSEFHVNFQSREEAFGIAKNTVKKY
jgi:hypothetical protein